jgi:serine/threonine-protein kinase
MSSAYRARDNVLERRVALKVLHAQHSSDADYVARFRREAQAVARLSHPNIVTVIDRGDFEGCQYIVLEHVEGTNLKDVVEREGGLPVAQALALTHQVARGLAFAHEHGIVHRDVKPQNVLLDADGRAKVTDFGIARSLDRDDALTLTGTLLGTSDYIAPEQASGERGDAQSDQYSLGALLYELLAGEPPYSGESVVTVAMRHVNDPVPRIRGVRPDVSPRVDTVIRRAMAKQSQERFPSTEAMIAALEACMADESAQERVRNQQTQALRLEPPTPVGRPRPPAATTGPPAWLAGAVLFAGLAVIALVLALLLKPGGENGPNVGGRGSPGPSGGKTSPVRLTAVSAYDPDGDGEEHPEDVAKATDGDSASYWTTETYGSFDKPGVGVVVGAPKAIALASLTLTTDEPGFTAEIRAGSSSGGPFKRVSSSRTVGTRTTFSVDTDGRDYRYYVIWITELHGRAHVNEVRARTEG